MMVDAEGKGDKTEQAPRVLTATQKARKKELVEEMQTNVEERKKLKIESDTLAAKKKVLQEDWTRMVTKIKFYGPREDGDVEEGL